MKHLKNKRIAVFGSGRAVENSPNWKLAFRAGKLLAESGFTVVNGGYRGVMEASAKGARSAGGHVIGVTAEIFKSARNSFIDTEIRTSNLPDRLSKLIEVSDGFILLDGGTGTLAELVTVWEMLSKGFFEKPAAVLGVYMKQVVRFVSRLPEVSVPPTLKPFSDPRRAIQFLQRSINSPE